MKKRREKVFDIHNYKLNFNIWGLVIFLLIMIPNLIWFMVPATHDVLRVDSVTPIVDFISSMAQVIMIFGLCFLSNNKETNSVSNVLKLSMGTALVFYYLGWLSYYVGFTYNFIILDLCIVPSIIFILSLVSYRNYITLIPTLIFTIGHLIFCLFNFIL